MPPAPEPEPTPDPETVLEGDWETTAETAEGVADVVITFDETGVVTRIVGTLDDGTTVSANITGATSTVDGDDVTLTIPLPNSDDVVTFEGTLSADENTLEGSLTRSIPIGDDVVVTIPAGDVTLNRGGAAAPECETDADCEEGEVCQDGECVEAPPAGCETDADCAEGQVCEDGACVDAPEEPLHKTLITEYEGTQTCLTCHADHAADIMETAHWNWSGVVDNIAGLEDQTHGKVDLINDY
jgi:hypothetical protein